jgi:uncharacterized protein YndB with AHSA1/START domain
MVSSKNDLQTEKNLEMVEIFNASPERVFKAWTDKNDFISWYGPEGFTVSFCEMDVRVGGAWRACIKSPTGEEYCMQGNYIEITQPSKLVFTYEDGSGKSQPGDATIFTITFFKKGQQTEMRFLQTNFPSKELRDAHFGGWSGAFDCLRDIL